MFKKFVKDRAHNRYEAYCCDDIDARVGLIEEQLAALVAGTVPDGAVTLAKLAADARTYTREINKGTLICEWIGTSAEYYAHLKENGGQPLSNVRYTITDKSTSHSMTADIATTLKCYSAAWNTYEGDELIGGIFLIKINSTSSGVDESTVVLLDTCDAQQTASTAAVGVTNSAKLKRVSAYHQQDGVFTLAIETLADGGTQWSSSGTQDGWNFEYKRLYTYDVAVG